MTFPAVRSSNSSPGRAPVISEGMTCASEQVMNIAWGEAPSLRVAACSRSPRTLLWKVRAWSINDCMEVDSFVLMAGMEDRPDVRAARPVPASNAGEPSDQQRKIGSRGPDARVHRRAEAPAP